MRLGPKGYRKPGHLPILKFLVMLKKIINKYQNKVMETGE